MRFVSNIFIALSLIIYIFCPFITRGPLGCDTGYQFVEDMINNSSSILYSIVSLIPFICTFLAIIFNCRRKLSYRIASIVITIAYLGFFSWLYKSSVSTIPLFNADTFAWGFWVSLWLVVAATAAIIASVAISIVSKKKYS